MEYTYPRRCIADLHHTPLFSAVAILLVLSNLVSNAHAAWINAPAKSDSFTPPDNYLLDCGSSAATTLPGKRVFFGDQETSNYLSYNGLDVQVSAPATALPAAPSPIYLSAKVFETEATYTFHVARPGWHWVRLHFAPVPNNKDLQNARFQVKTSNNLVLIHEFKLPDNQTWELREFLVNVTTERFSLTFEPSQGGLAYINAIEFVSAPDILLRDEASAVFPKGDYSGLMKNAYQTVYRLNVGGPVITAQNC